MKILFTLFTLLSAVLLFGAPASQPTLAVLPFQISKVTESAQIGNLKLTRDLVEKEFSNELTNFLVHSRKFNIVNRDTIDKVMNENLLTESDWVNPNEYQKVGNLLVAEYLVTGVINRVEFQSIRQNIKITGEIAPRMVATFKTQFQVIETNTGKIVYSGQVIKKLKSRDVRREIPASERKDWSVSDYKDLLFSRVAKNMGNKILEAVYPIKITGIQSNGRILVLNRGQSAGIEVGDEFEIVKQGETIIDVDTGEDLGNSENSIAKIKVALVDVKFSKAILKDDNTEINIGDICRPIPKNFKTTAPSYPTKDLGW
jgi:hypothetical protein